MKVCMILEGCYPYVRGGVSTWVHQYLTNSPEMEFALWTVHADERDTKEPLYQFPENVKDHRMVILDSGKERRRNHSISRETERAVTEAMVRVIRAEEHSFEDLTTALRGIRKGFPSDILRSESFLEMAQKVSDETPGLGLADAFYGLQSMFLPIIRVLTASIPEADIYHSAVTGYGGLFGAMAAMETKKPFVLTEHGIYPREREEELISSDWTVPPMRQLWIRLFYEMSKFAYRHASRVTSLFEEAKARQITIGCSPSKCTVIPNGIMTEKFRTIEYPKDCREIHIGAFVRFAQIKDLKTLIHAFAIARQKMDNIVLHIMGGTDDPEYHDACLALIDRLEMKPFILVEGHIDTIEYMKRMHMTILTSISEGQPLTLLESMASGRPCIATRVGNCSGLIEEEIDGIGAAGICCTPMMADEIASALVRLCSDEFLRITMGRNGRKRVQTRYLLRSMLDAYHAVYQEVI